MRHYSEFDKWTEAITRHVVATAQRSLAERNAFHLVLAGGGTPRPVYERLGTIEEIEWSRVDFWWGDERCVPPEHADSNYRMACETWLNHVDTEPARVHRIRGELGPHEAAMDYVKQIAVAFAGDTPQFDLVLLGMGDDGHTASLFPGRPEAADAISIVVAALGPSEPTERVSLGLRPLREARERLLMLRGTTKRGVYERIASDADSESPLRGMKLEVFTQ